MAIINHMPKIPPPPCSSHEQILAIFFVLEAYKHGFFSKSTLNMK